MTKRSAGRANAGAVAQDATDAAGRRLRLIGVSLVCAKVALIPVVFDPNSDVPFSGAKAMTSHALAYVLAGVMLALLVHSRSSLLVRSPLHIPVVAFLIANIGATLVAADPVLALFGVHDRMTGLGTLTDGVLLYFAIVCLVRTRAQATALAGSFVVGAVVVLIYEWIQLVGLDPWTWAIDSGLPPFSTMGQTNSLALYLIVVTAGAAALAFYRGTLPSAARVGLLLLAAVALAGVVVTQTRSALFGLVAGGGLLIVLTWTRHPHRRARLAALVGGLGVSSTLAVILLFTPLGARFLTTVEFSAAVEGDAGPRLEASAAVRAALYRIAFDMVRERPLLGYGPDNFLPNLPRFRSDHEPVEVQDRQNTSAHGWFAQVAVASGILGLTTFLAIAVLAVVLTFKRGFRPEAWAALAMMAAFLGAGVTTVNAVATDWLFWATIGGVAAATSHTSRTESVAPAAIPATTARRARSAPVHRRKAPLFASVALVAAGLVLAATTTSALDASRSARTSRVARLQGGNQRAIEFGLRATRSDSLRAEYWETLGLAYVSAERFADAVLAFEHASNLAPYDVRYDGDLARALTVLAQRGDAVAAARARDVADRLVRTDPNHPLANFVRATVMQALGNLPEALKAIERALALDRTRNRDMYVTGTQVYSALGRRAEAIALAGRGIDLMPDQVSQVPIRVELSRALAANGQLPEALAEIDKALAIVPSHAAALQLRAQIQAALGR